MGVTSLSDIETKIEGAPEGIHVAPRTVDDVARVLRWATESGTPVRVWGGGTRQKLGHPPAPGIVLSTSRLSDIEVWEPDDLTVVAGAGIGVAELESRLGEKSQTAVLPERPGAATLGGVLATGRASLRRARLLGPRERVLEVTMVTGDGRVVRSGGRVVKNVSGFDLHRAAIGAFGSLGVIVQVCLKLWPVPRASATISHADPESVSRITRPLALLETNEAWQLFAWGTPTDIDEIVAKTEGEGRAGLHWPEDPRGSYRWLLRVPPGRTAEAALRVRPWRFLAIHGSGELRLSSEDIEGATDLRGWAEDIGGSLVLVDHPGEDAPLDPWGLPPSTLDLQRRLIAEFDPARIVNPGRLPGGL